MKSKPSKALPQHRIVTNFFVMLLALFLVLSFGIPTRSLAVSEEGGAGDAAGTSTQSDTTASPGSAPDGDTGDSAPASNAAQKSSGDSRDGSGTTTTTTTNTTDGAETTTEEKTNASDNSDEDIKEESEASSGSATITDVIVEGENTVLDGQEVTFENDAEPEKAEEETAFDPESEENKAKIDAEKTVISDPVVKEVVDIAIQKAVDEALKSFDGSQSSIVITVAAGTYNGDISIGAVRTTDTEKTTTYQDAEGNELGKTTETIADGQELYNYSDKDFSGLTLIIVAADAGEDQLSAGGGVQINGNITIDGINTVLAGLYYSLKTGI